MRRLGSGLLAFFLGVASLFATQTALTRLWTAFGVSWGRENLPTLPMQQFAALSTLFVAVFVGSFVAAFLGRRDAWRVLAVMCLVGISIDGYVMFVKLQDALPLWFKLSFVSQIPVATAIAGLLCARYWPPGAASAGTAG